MGAVQCCGSLPLGSVTVAEPSSMEQSLDAIHDDGLLPEEAVLQGSSCCLCPAMRSVEVSSARSSCSQARRSKYKEFQTQGGRESILSSSALGAILKAQHRDSNTTRVLRQINKKRLLGFAWKDEFQQLRRLDHPHICKCHDLWEDSMCVYMILDFCKGGNLTDLGACEESINETSIAVLMEQMVGAVQHLHDQQLVHTDLRPENWLFSETIHTATTPLDMNLKMIDFGLAVKHGRKGKRSFNEGTSMIRLSGASFNQRVSLNRPGSVSPADTLSEVGGTEMGAFGRLFCLAPEQVCGSSSSPVSSPLHQDKHMDRSAEQVSEKADIWSLGVISYFMLSGSSPFSQGPAGTENDPSFQNARFVFMPTNIWRPISSEAKHFIALCLQKDPSCRPSAKQLNAMPWIQMARQMRGGEVPSEGSPNVSRPSRPRMTLQDPPLPTASSIRSSFDHMRSFQLISRSIVLATAFNLQSERITDVFRACEAKDTTKSGMLPLQDLLSILYSAGLPILEYMQMAASPQGPNVNDCCMAYVEFFDEVRDFQRNAQEHAVWEVFSAVSGSGNHRVRRSNLAKALNDREYGHHFEAKFPRVSINQVIKELRTSEGSVGMEEFKQIVAGCDEATPTRQLMRRSVH